MPTNDPPEDLSSQPAVQQYISAPSSPQRGDDELPVTDGPSASLLEAAQPLLHHPNRVEGQVLTRETARRDSADSDTLADQDQQDPTIQQLEMDALITYLRDKDDAEKLARIAEREADRLAQAEQARVARRTSTAEHQAQPPACRMRPELDLQLMGCEQ